MILTPCVPIPKDRTFVAVLEVTKEMAGSAQVNLRIPLKVAQNSFPLFPRRIF